MAVQTHLCKSAVRLQGWGREHARCCWKPISPLYKAGISPTIKCKVASRFPFPSSPALFVRWCRKGLGGYLLFALALLLFK